MVALESGLWFSVSRAAEAVSCKKGTSTVVISSPMLADPRRKLREAEHSRTSTHPVRNESSNRYRIDVHVDNSSISGRKYDRLDVELRLSFDERSHTITFLQTCPDLQRPPQDFWQGIQDPGSSKTRSGSHQQCLTLTPRPASTRQRA